MAGSSEEAWMRALKCRFDRLRRRSIYQSIMYLTYLIKITRF